jgi:hypothetical protein
VLFAGSIVVLALLGMLLVGVSITSGIAVGEAVEVAFTVAPALTLLPAVLSLLGTRVNSLRVPGRHPAGSPAVSPRLSSWARFVQRRRWAVGTAVIAVLAVLALPLLSLRLVADGFLDGLKDAVRDRRPFNPRAGLPEAETTEGEIITWHDHARAYAEAKWGSLVPVSRRWMGAGSGGGSARTDRISWPGFQRRARACPACRCCTRTPILLSP